MSETLRDLLAILENAREQARAVAHETPLDAALITVTVSHLTSSISVVEMAATATGANIEAPEDPTLPSH